MSKLSFQQDNGLHYQKILVTFPAENELLTGTQHVFGPGMSCLRHPLHLFVWVMKQQLHHLNMDVIYFYFAKALEIANRCMTCHKLHDLPIAG